MSVQDIPDADHVSGHCKPSAVQNGLPILVPIDDHLSVDLACYQAVGLGSQLGCSGFVVVPRPDKGNDRYHGSGLRQSRLGPPSH